MLIGSEVYSIVTYLLSENQLDGNSDYWRMRSSHKNNIWLADKNVFIMQITLQIKKKKCEHVDFILPGYLCSHQSYTTWNR